MRRCDTLSFMGKRSSAIIASDVEAAVQQRQNALVIVTLIVMTLAMLRCLVMVFPQLYWDVDPRSQLEGQVLTGMGPVGASLMDMLSVVAAATAMFFHHQAGGKLGWKSGVLAVAGGAVCLWQLPRYGPGMLTVGSWVAAMALAVAVYHLAQHRRALLVMTAMLAALIVPWFLKSLVYVYWDHAQTLEMFLKDEAKSVAAHGWNMGSPQHILFKRRLEFPDVTGSFGLSNVYGSVVAGIGIISAGLTATLLKTRQPKRALLPAVLLLISLITLYYTHSKGAVVAMVMGMGLLGLVVMSWRWKKMCGLIAPMAMVCVLLAVGLVVVRGAMGPPDSDQGERSLLFRYHYWQGAAGMLAHEPWREKLLGVGPGQFKDSYILYKNPLNPEEVTSTHNVILDFVTMLGVGGAAWSVLVFGWLWVAGRAAGSGAVREKTPIELSSVENEIQASDAAKQMDRDVKLALATAAAIFGFQFYTQFATMLVPEQFLSWAMGAVGFIAVMVLLGSERWMTTAGAQMALFLGASVLLIHNQIEMTFYNPQAGPLVFVIVAAAAGAGSQMLRQRHEASQSSALPTPSASYTPEVESGLHVSGSLVMMMAMLVGAGVMLVTYVLPHIKQDAALSQSAELLRGGQHMQSIQVLDQAIEAIPRDPRTIDSKVMLLAEAATYYAKEKQIGPAQQLMSQAMVTLDAAFAAGLDDVALVRRRAQMFEASSEMFNDPGRMTTAINVWMTVMQRAPYSLMDALHLADLLWNTGRRDEAKQWYERTLTLDQDNYLDPAKQLLPEQKAHVETRLVELKTVKP